ncbi:hypothetical protein Lgor_2766 [Fluoribacter gormanii]|uniref:Uncharacterized protein n=1 Tax=Fluoribacter gormanii TaxID=464 RepID=A0A377GJK3_9GAMM|nr:hypothetical protein Lgor_2766 [Fluoribacter gormanii]SIQ79983.1 hypothetical protein SAMN05421777_103106 [Fluoribacter gormanii]STO24996.1 Uncharacterised protein [Fluoribacter gormanii]
MQDKRLELILSLFLIRISGTSQKYGMGQAYIQGQLEEACHQLTLYCKRNNKDLHHGF